MSATNRETVRDALTTLLTTALVGTGKPAQAVYGYKVGDFQGQSPVVLITSAGTQREENTYTRWMNTFSLSVMVFVLYADPGTGWGEDDAEDRLDLLEKTIADTLRANYSYAGGWDRIIVDGATQVVEVDLGGEQYLLEIIPVKAGLDDAD